MLLRAVLGLIGLVELIAPRRFARFWVNRCCENPDEVELKSWVITAIRLEGVAILAWVAWASREDLEHVGDPTQWLGEEITTPEIEIEPDETAPLRPGTTRFDLAAALYQADEPVAVSELVSRSEGTAWEVGRSSASATLYRMHRDGLVDRRERDEGRGFEYWISDDGVAAIEAIDATIEPGTPPAGE